MNSSVYFEALSLLFFYSQDKRTKLWLGFFPRKLNTTSNDGS